MVSDDDEEEYPSTLHMNDKHNELDRLHKKTQKTEKDLNYNAMLHARLQNLMSVMAEMKQGCIRF